MNQPSMEKNQTVMKKIKVSNQKARRQKERIPKALLKKVRTMMYKWRVEMNPKLMAMRISSNKN